jgi:YNFM family putative membrane transporter
MNTRALQIEAGTLAYRRITIAMFLAGFATFALVYNVQPLLPVFSREFGISAAQSSLSVSLTTAFLAAGLLIAGSLSEVWGRKPIMVTSLLAASLFAVLASIVPTWYQFLLVRALEGIAISGLPAIAMAYLSEELHARALGLAMGLYIGGTGLGGMAGRLLTGILTDVMSWRFAIGVIGVFCIFAALVFWRSLPASLQFRPVPFERRALIDLFVSHAHDAGLPWLFAEAFLLAGSFVTVYNYIGYRLMAPPFLLSHSAVGAIFLIYLAGIGSSAWVGHLAGRLGRRNILWTTFVVMLGGVLVALPNHLVAIIAGLTIYTVGFFGCHSVLASWVGLRAVHGKAQASSLYLFSYYMGASLVGWVGGFFWDRWHWVGVSGFVGCMLIVALAISVRLIGLQPKVEVALAPVPN